MTDYTTAQYRCTAAHAAALQRLAARLRAAGVAVGDRPLSVLEACVAEVARQQRVTLPPRTATTWGGPRPAK